MNNETWRLTASTIRKGLVLVIVTLLLAGCQQLGEGDSAEQTTDDANEHASHAAPLDGTRDELTETSPIELDLAKGSEIGIVYQAFLSPHQEGEDEEDTPESAPEVFKSTAPSVPRSERDSHGHGVLAFSNDLSKAHVYVAIENVNPEDIVMFHIHCGRPGQLGPIIIDFGLAGNLQDFFEDGVLALELTNDDIEAAADHGEGIVGAFTAGCPITIAIPLDKHKTIGGMQFVAEQGELYFNLHTKGQTFFGDIRGQLIRVD